ncbi:MAG: hypothetical protein AUK55_11830 [Syntrophobacteraceae bacterium CG2_30_61_12]|nr:MAG: hypothetical protein AUK55_11830 [Syntrophobacteraceae bacterium CG2_30_61_12]
MSFSLSKAGKMPALPGKSSQQVKDFILNEDNGRSVLKGPRAARDRNRILGLVPALVGLLLALALWAPAPGSAMTLSQEKELGRKYLKLIQEYFPMAGDEDLITYVESVGKRVAGQLGPTQYDYRFYVIDNPTTNAFTIPGGAVFLFRGLIALMDSEDELAGIISHELAHSQAQHLERQMEKSRNLSIATIAGTLAAVFLGLPPATTQALALGVQAGSKTLQLQYSRENEEEADRIGFRYLCTAGYNPQAMVSVMRKMKQKSWSTSPKVPSYLLTHPGLGERIIYLQGLVDEQQKQPGRKASWSPTGDFQLMHAAILGHYVEPQEAERELQTWFQQPGKEGAAWYGLGRLALRQGQYPNAYDCLKKAVAIRPDSALVLSSLGLAQYYLGDLKAAEHTLNSAILLNPDCSSAHYRLALVLQDQGDYREALRQLQKVQHLADVLADFNYQIGVIYGKLNQLGPAHYYLGKFYDPSDLKLALFHFTKAKGLLPAQDSRQEEIDEAVKDLEDRLRLKKTEEMRRSSRPPSPRRVWE